MYTKYHPNVNNNSAKSHLYVNEDVMRCTGIIYMRIYCKLAQHVQFSNYNIWLKLVGDGAVLF